MSSLELSIIVPVLNEIAVLPNFFAGLLRQREITYEVVVVDGGSSDGSLQWLQRQQQSYSHIKVISSAKGRACQLNTGAAHAVAPWLLFLHVDSLLDDDLALRQSVDLLATDSSALNAGHFPLCFLRSKTTPSFGYYFYQAKTVSGRRETIHGDQGFLLSRLLFERVGLFDEKLPVMEDTDFAERLRLVGCWQTLPFIINTSARRFEVEGLWQRQLIGALIMCFRTIGWYDFICQAPDIYRQQKQTDRLKVSPFFNLIKMLLNELPAKRRREIWLLSGCYVRGHAWQLFFCLDAVISYLRGKPSSQVQMRVTRFCEPLFSTLTGNRMGNRVATLLLQGWFHVTAFILAKVENILINS